MKAKVGIMIGVLIIAFAVMVIPVMAEDTSAYILGNPTGAVSVSLNQTSVNLTPFTPGLTASNASMAVIVSANEPWTVNVQGSTPDSSASATAYLTNSSVSSPYDLGTPETTLGNKLEIDGSNANTTYGETYLTTQADLTDVSSQHPLYAGSVPYTAPLWLSNNIKQSVSYYDPVLPDTYAYQIKLTFTITSS